MAIHEASNRHLTQSNLLENKIQDAEGGARDEACDIKLKLLQTGVSCRSQIIKFSGGVRAKSFTGRAA
jgi:hypothetical protein